ncbi:MAG: DoxX family membrane protein [Deltaproteobacteria bacterium]|nr:DoxX family membrane protein [Deltaproteobacteria bacterium]MCB9480071.1 DoxX family membrane protein [Deltaproteobacteria bacterium]MCB9487129.1 DoxX family membrane protein [Deltaproteobacteria bacterium]
MSGKIRELLSNRYLIIALRLFFGGMYLYASYDKILNPHDFSIAVANYQLVPRVFINLFALALPWLEFLIGVFLVAGIFVEASALISAALCLMFTIGIIQALARGLDISCGCFHQGDEGPKISVWLVYRDILLVLGSVWILEFNNGRWTFLPKCNIGWTSDGLCHKRTSVLAAGIGAAALVLAVGLNAVRSEPLPWVKANLSDLEDDEDVTQGPVTLEGAKRLFDEGAVFFDARPQSDFDQGHIKGARHLYYADYSDEIGMQLLEEIPLDATLVTYCSGEECHASDLLARNLLILGYEKVRIFFGGWPEWVDAGYPTEKTPGVQAPSLYQPMAGE